MALLTIDDLELWLPQAEGASTLLTAVIARAEATAAQHCFRSSFESGSLDQYYSSYSGQRVIQLLDYPVTAVTTVSEWAQETTPSTIDATGYDVGLPGGMLWRRGSTWAVGFEQVRVQYTAGYSTSTLPADLKHAMIELCGWMLDRRGGYANKTESIDGASETREDMVRGVPMSLASMFRDYVTVVMV